MRRGLALEDHVEHGVETRGAGQRCAQLALADRDRPRGRLPVQHARNEALLAQAPRLGRAEPLALLDLQTMTLSSHDAGV
jgi:hypothetical protein